MINNRKNGFTLVELLAVIAVLGLILIIAVPKVMDTLNTQKKRTLELTTKSIIKAAEEKYLENSAYGLDEEITCESISNITSSDFESCKIYFDEVGNASVTLIGKGRYDGINVCNGTKISATATKEKCELVCGFNEALVSTIVEIPKPYEIKNQNNCAIFINGIARDFDVPEEELSEFESICYGQSLDGMTFNDFVLYMLDEGVISEEELIKNNIINATIEKSCVNTVLNCTFDGELVQGAEFTHNQYTYRYKQKQLLNNGDIPVWMDMQEDGWGAILTDKESTDSVNTPVCTYINDKPILSTSSMFAGSQATSIDLSRLNTSNIMDMSAMFYGTTAKYLDLSNFDTSKVTDMKWMFAVNFARTLDLSSFDTSNVTDMSYMFNFSKAIKLDLSNFDTSNVTNMNSMFIDSAATTLDLKSFNTSNVTSMNRMFAGSQATSLDLSSFNTSNVTDMRNMFYDSQATIGYARNQTEADKFNDADETGIPDTLTFIVKPSS